MRLRSVVFPLFFAFSALLGGSGGASAQAAGQLAGVVIAADGGDLSGLRISVGEGTGALIGSVAPSGYFSVGLPRSVGGALSIWIEPEPRGTDRYHPAEVRIRNEDLASASSIILVPRQWTITSGRFAGQTVEIDLEKVFARPCSGCPAFFRRGVGDDVAVPTWPEAVFPLRLAFEREPGQKAITPRDSVALWRIVGEMERTLGADLFRPATLEQTAWAPERPRSPEDVVHIRIDRSLRDAGVGSVGYVGGDILYGSILLKSAGALHQRGGERLVIHELMHALGFGHTCAWRSAMADVGRCPSKQSSDLTAEDVAYAQLLRRIADLERAYGARWEVGDANRRAPGR